MMKKQKLFCVFFAGIVFLFVALSVRADDDLSDDIAAGQAQVEELEKLYGDMQDKIDELEKNKEDLSDYLASLNQSYHSAQVLIQEYNNQIDTKQKEVDDINLKLEEAKEKQTEQYEAMKLRIQFMYESSDMDIAEVLMSDKSLSEILNQVEYIAELLAYDKTKMEEYENLLVTIQVMKNQAEEEMRQLSDLKTKQEAAVDELTAFMADASANIKAHEEQISVAEQAAIAYEKELEEQKNSLEELKQEESRRIAESIAESIRESEEASRKQAALEAGQTYEEQTTAMYVPQANDLTKLAAIIYCEAGGEPYEGQLAVGTVVMNRVASSKYPNTIEEVLMQPYQFSPVGSGRYAIALAKEPNPSCLKAAKEVLENGVRTGTWLYFRVKNDVIKGDIIGNQVFY